MKNLSKKLVMSIVAVTLVVAALGASTFAWFTLSNRASVGTFEAQVSSGEGIEIRLLNQSNWYTDIPTNIIQNYINDEIGFENFKDITTTDGRTFTRYTKPTDIITKTDYVEFVLEFRSTQELTVYWTSAIISEAAPVTWISDADYVGIAGSVNVGDPVTLYPSNAARVSITGLVGLGTPTLTTNVYQKGETQNNVVLGTTATLPGAINYYNAKNNPDLVVPASLSVPTTISPVFDTVDIDNNSALVTLKKALPTDAYAVGSITVRVWIEGWDADTYNAILGEKIKIQLAFEGK